ncbi:MAG: fimbrillin family protein [Tannerellaceae bacterium]|nr:fimbrillin family protein [Tannerellaceae bacterium]
MKPVLHVFILLVTCCLLAGCNEQDINHPDNDLVAVTFSMADSPASTRVSDDGTQWSQYDSIGIFMMESGKGIEFIVEGADNMKFRQYFQVSKRCFFFPDMIPIYYPVDGRPVDFISYYPFNRNITDHIYPVDVSSEYQEMPKYIDIVYSDNAKGYTKNSTDSVNLAFSHKLSKLTFTLKEGEGAPDLTDTKIKISNLYRKADFDLSNGQITNLASPGEIGVDYNPRDPTSDPTRLSLIVIPQKAENSILTVTLPNEQDNRYEWKFPPSTEFMVGYQHPYTITVSKTGIQVSQGDITDWTDTSTEAKVGSYKIGDYYPDPDVNLNDLTEVAKILGVIVWLDPLDSHHGKVLGLKQFQLAWATDQNVDNATDQDNGRKNMKAIHDKGNWAAYPVFNRVHALNDPAEDYSDENKTHIWYIPALQEALTIGRVMNSYGIDALNSRLTAIGGDEINRNSYYFSSTEYSDRYAYYWRHSYQWSYAYKWDSTTYPTRYIMAF